MHDPNIRVLLADDHDLAREGIRQALETASDIEIIGEAASGADVCQMVEQLRPDVLLLDLIMPGVQASEIEAWVRQQCHEVVTLILTGHDRDAFLAQSLKGGAAGYLTKEEQSERLIEAIRCAARGEILVTGEQKQRAETWQNEVGDRWERLTEQQRTILYALSTGLENKAIAAELSIAVKTVESHTRAIFRTLGITSRSQAIVWMLKNFPDWQPKKDQG